MIFFFPVVLGIFVAPANGAYPPQLTDLSIAPEFDPTPLAVNVMPGETALLPCRVRNLADKVVSWMRRKDLLIISSGRFMFTGDSRFQVISPELDPATWNLQLRQAKLQDEGLYECQVNTDPKLKQAVLLTVSDFNMFIDKPDAMEMSLKDDSRAYGSEETIILGSKERYVRVGNRLTVTCHVRTKPDYVRGRQRPLSFVSWLHNDVPLSDSVVVDTEKDGNEYSSTLTVNSIGPDSGGKYTCKPSVNAKSASILVTILEGERTEAMQGQSSATTASPSSLSLLFLLHLLALRLL